ncbi:MAG: TlpA disulfide reductase family protein [Peptococcaceae bacterium]|nr:TlpA disulfide reductase family protein [Peptococcaceae bacterium]
MAKKKRTKVFRPELKTQRAPWLLIGGVLAGVIIVAMLLLKFTPVSASKVVEVGKPAPDFTLSRVNGQQISLSQYKGKPVIVNFWATWCPPCRMEMPTLEELSKQAAAKGFVLLAVDQEEDAATVQNFFAKNHYDYPVVLDTTGAVSSLYNVSGIPTTIFIDSSGIVRTIHVGTMPELQLFLNKIPS